MTKITGIVIGRSFFNDLFNTNFLNCAAFRSEFWGGLLMHNLVRGAIELEMREYEAEL